MRRIALLLLLPPVVAAGEPLWVGRFPAAGELPPPWQVEPLNKKVPPTRYRLREWDGVRAVEAHAQKSMALLARPLEVDLGRTPVLCWRWRVDATLRTADLATKAGDDYAARVYLSFAIPEDKLDFALRFKLSVARSLWGAQVPDAALNYVWDNRHPVGTVRPNAYTERAMMWVLKSGDGEAGRWAGERRDLAADFLQAFGHPPARLTGLAVAADTDNTGEEAHAGFADFAFVGRNDACPPA